MFIRYVSLKEHFLVVTELFRPIVYSTSVPLGYSNKDNKAVIRTDMKLSSVNVTYKSGGGLNSMHERCKLV